jgi:plasmid stabilization system protein ParE
VTVVLTDPAREDLAAIYSYHAERSSDRAGRVIGAILHAANLLADFPLMGRQGVKPGTREA